MYDKRNLDQSYKCESLYDTYCVFVQRSITLSYSNMVIIALEYFFFNKLQLVKANL